MATTAMQGRWRSGTAGAMLLALVAAGSVAASALDALTSKDARGGLRAALTQGIEAAVGRLGVKDGFLANPQVRIPLPPALDKVDRTLRNRYKPQ